MDHLRNNERKNSPRESAESAERLDEQISKNQSVQSILQTKRTSEFTSSDVQNIQRLIGNRQTQSLLNRSILQRDGTTGTTPVVAPAPTSTNIEPAKHHVTVGDGVDGNVKGAHDYNALKALQTAGLIKIMREEDTGIEGVKQAYYKLPLKDGTGYKAKEHLKTVYDPTVWTWDRLLAVATNAAIDSHSRVPWGSASAWEGSGKDASGKGPYSIAGYQSGGSAATFFFKT